MSNKDNHLIFERYIHNEPMNEGLKDVLAAGALGLASLAGPNKDVQAAAPTPAVQNVQDAKETIKKEIRNNEGFEERTYADPIHKMKVPTVGYGFSLKEAHVQKALKEAGVNVSDIYNVVLNKQQAEKALDILLNQAIADARAYFQITIVYLLYLKS